MRKSALILAGIVGALLVVQSFSVPCTDDQSSIEASKSSKSSNSKSGSCDASSQEINAKNADGGEYKEKSSKSAAKTASASSSENVETYKAYKAGAPACDDSLPPRKTGECDETYYKHIFPVSECDKASVKAFYVKVFKQYKGESDDSFVKRIDCIFTKVYKSLDCRLDDEYLCYLEKYYVIKYAKKDCETEEAYFKRVITKTTETEEQYNDKIVILKRYIKTVNWSHIKVNYKCAAGYTYVKTTSTSTGKSLDSGSYSEEEIKKEYIRKTSETDEVYFKRIVTKKCTSTTTEEYVKDVSAIRKCYPTLALWYNEKYVPIIKEYYTALYKKHDFEDVNNYYNRIVTKESFETHEQAAKRANCVRVIYPTLDLWYNEKYLGKYTKWIYTLVFKKGECEDDTTYYKRVVARVKGETDLIYVARIDLIVKTFISLPLWHSEKTFPIVKEYYTIKYTKSSGESEEDYFKRLTQREICDSSNEVYAQRMNLVHKVTVACNIWYEENYYEKYTKGYYSVYYKKGDKESCTAWLIRVITVTPGACEDNMIKKIKLINRSKSGCKCWTAENIKKIECSFKKEYLDKIRKAFIKSC